MYTKKEDITKLLMKPTELASLGSDSEVAEALKVAEEDAFSYLQHYDVESIKKQTGEERSKKLVTVICDLGLYILVSKNQLSQIPEQRVIRSKEAIRWLQMVSTGIIDPGFPKKKDKKSVFWSSYTPLGELI